MASNAPKVDEREQQKFIEQLNLLMKSYIPEWKQSELLQSDQNAQALIHIFARMMELVTQRLNKAPDKNLLHFLEMLGVSLSPPRVARAPLVFFMTPGAKQYGYIPAGTQVADDSGTLVFETAKDLTIILPKPVKAISLDPEKDLWQDHSSLLSGENPTQTAEELFRGQALTPHRIYFGSKEFFGYQEPVTVKIDLDIIPPNNPSPKWNVQWYCYRDGRLIHLEPFGDPDIVNLLSSGKLYFPYLSNVDEYSLQGSEVSNNQIKSWKNNWIFAELQTSVTKLFVNELPVIKGIRAGIEINTPARKGIETVFSQGVNLYGVKTFFKEQEIHVGDWIIANSQMRKITKLSSDVSQLILEKPFNPDLPSGTPFSFTRIIQANGKIKYYTRPHSSIQKDFLQYSGPNLDEEIQIGQIIIVGQEIRVVKSIDSKIPGCFTVNEAFNHNLSNAHNFNYVLAPLPIPLDVAFYNNNALDLSKDFWPFGERPEAFHDTFYLASREVFSKKGSLVILHVEKSIGGKLTIQGDGLKLDWEYWDGESWKTIPDVDDGTDYFTKVGRRKIVFTLPEIKLTKVNGMENYWIRIRITNSGYFYIEKTQVAGSMEEIDITEYRPPIIRSIRLSYIMVPVENVLESIITCNGFEYQDQIKVNTGHKFLPFQSVSEDYQRESTFYLGFDQDIRGLPVSLFFPLLDNTTSYLSSIKADINGSKNTVDQVQNPVIAWEYHNSKDWSLLSVEDETQNLTRRGMIQFLVPTDLEPRFLFESSLYWIRARLAQGQYRYLPKLGQLYSNAVWAYHLTTVQEELLGSSNGIANQQFTLAGSPVLPGQQILIGEPALTQAERSELSRMEGTGAVTEIHDPAGNVVELWARWHEVNSFHFSGPNDRHYLVDRSQGRIIFGDGERGKIPPAGRNNIKCGFYQYGGGAKGNVQPKVLTKLRTTYPYVDKVTNPEAADGGVDQENLDRTRERGPQTIKHKDRAVTYEDYEWLVKEASAKVAKAKCLPITDPMLQHNPGWVTVMVVPEIDDPRPYPSQELIQNIEEYLFARTSSHLVRNPSQIRVIGPKYLRIDTEAKVKYQSSGAAKVVEGKIVEALRSFFHSLHGGPERKGWEFGRSVYISEVCEVIEKVEGVDYVQQLVLKPSAQSYVVTTGSTGLPLKTMVAYPHGSFLKRKDGNLSWITAEKLPANTDLNSLPFTILGFKEDDQIVIKSITSERVTLPVKSVRSEGDGDLIEFEPFSPPQGGLSSESTIETLDGRVRSLILDTVKIDNRISSFKVAKFRSEDQVRLVNRNSPSSSLPPEDYFNIMLYSQSEIVFLEDHYLVYSGTHTINSV